MNSIAPAEILHGLPMPNRRRWQPLRAGILGLFRYDEQIFTFYRGRLLLRGNNGTGKSMALEVLLPFLLDADLRPEKLSTFGSRTRTMHTWLIGHDSNPDRTSARGYVWVEYGRITDQGAQFFTTGAGLQATRSSKNTNAWYFTTSARIGREQGQLHLGSAGTEAVGQNQLTADLESLSVLGLSGRIHSTSGAYRDEVNRVLYRLEERQFDALRKAMLNLRKPKLSDKLSEDKLAEVLRESLPPVDEVVTEELADGFERLDRHREKARQLLEAEAALTKVFNAYLGYLHALIGLRSTALAASANLLDETMVRHKALSAALTTAKTDFNSVQEAKKTVTDKVRTATAELQAIEKLPLFAQGAQIEPLREKADGLRSAANSLDGRAQLTRYTAAALHHKAELANVAAQEAQAGRGAAGEAAERAALDLSRRSLWELAVRLAAEFAEHEDPRRHSPIAAQRLHSACEEADKELEHLLMLTRRSTDAADRLATAVERTRSAKDAVTSAQEAVVTANHACAEQIDLYLEAVADWVGTSPQLTVGAPAPAEWPRATCEQAVADWTTDARQTRQRQLSVMAGELAKARPVVAGLPEHLGEFGDYLDTLRGSLRQLWEDAWRLRGERVAFADTVARWVLGLRELPLGLAVPDHLSAPAPLQLTRDQVRTWTDLAFGRRSQQLAEAAVPLRMEIDENDRAHDEARSELDQLIEGAVQAPEPPGTRLASRAERPGAPFYLLVDFLDADDTEACALLEAALEGAGLLDAWVLPDGSVLADQDGRPVADLVLTTMSAPVPGSLAGALRPDPSLADGNCPMPESVVTALLERVRLVPTVQQDFGDHLTVGLDGSWAIGPLRGAYHKDTSEYVGAASREARRRRRIHELAEILQELAVERRRLNEVLTANEESGRRLTDERAGVPDDEAWRQTDNVVVRTRTRFTHQLAVVATGVRKVADAVAKAAEQGNTALSPVGSTPIEIDAHPLTAWADGGLAGLGELADSVTTLVWEQDVRVLDAVRWPDEAVSRMRTQCGQAIAVFDTATEIVDQRQRDLDEQVRALPSPAALAECRSDLVAKETMVAVETRQLKTFQQEETTRRNEAESAQMVADTALRLADLTGKQEWLPELRKNLGQFRVDGQSWLGAAALAEERSIEAGQRTADAVEAAGVAEAARQEADTAIATAKDAERQYERLNADMGKPYQELMANHAELAAGLVHNEEELAKASAKELETHGEVQRLAAESAAAGETANRARRALAGDANQFADLHRLGLIAAVSEELAEAAPALPLTFEDSPDRLPDLCAWAARIADVVPRQSRDGRQLDAAHTRVGAVRQEIEAQLAGRVVLRERFDRGSVLVVTGARNGLERPLRATLRQLLDERKEIDDLLRASESEVFERFLSDEVRLTVSNHLRAAKTLLSQANQLMGAHPTGSGLRFQLGWEPDPKGDMPDRVLEHLKKPAGTLWPSQRAELIEFYQKRIQRERGKNLGMTWREQMARLLDYRLWFRFVLMVSRDDGPPARLSSRLHAQMSGGEKAIALHMPLFAAAATHCQASRIRVTENNDNGPGCPRLILLDEVFAGVDAENRGALFALVKHLDLDLVATSESEQGLHPQLDGLAIYHLVVDQALDGVLAVHTVWDGREEHHMLEHEMSGLG
ncbi:MULTISPECIES: SbcC/MukB-like Walker B domain-containing protein [unclassified Crossiella]|uniref:SbcC/MukB-like Walker B domain-containing protein n=1 Tax=unclassified Crossiella TaxID=2620835 RepID=UPI001FFF073C|nr:MULTISPECIES: SbcC/MukB-like Walker B domain-containing protein [unclassified Crossiella]MCK2241902.1 hypothetical protein [Crossiella sp. S99.2]MCK2255805.1 hypothetical protein [Crossiella sp. S99.1]